MTKAVTSSSETRSQMWQCHASWKVSAWRGVWQVEAWHKGGPLPGLTEAGEGAAEALSDLLYALSLAMQQEGWFKTLLEQPERTGLSVWNGKPTCLSCSPSPNANVALINGLFMSGCSAGPGTSGPDQWNTNTPAGRWGSQGRTAAAHSPPASAFISGYTDLKNEGRAPNVLFVCFSFQPKPSFSIPFLSLCLSRQPIELKWKTTGILNKCRIDTDGLQRRLHSEYAALIYDQLVSVEAHHSIMALNRSQRGKIYQW